MGSSGRALLLAILSCLAFCTPVSGETFYVTTAEDGGGFGFTCHGGICNLRTAWLEATINDTILIQCNPVMEDVLTFHYEPDNTTNGSITVMGPPNGVVITGSSNRFLAMDNYPFGHEKGVFVQLVFKNIEFSGFRYAPQDEDHAYPGLIFCITNGEGCHRKLPHTAQNSGSMSVVGQASLPRPHPRERESTNSGPLGENQTPYGNFSTLAKQAMLVISNCVFRNNSYLAPSRACAGTMIYTSMRHNGLSANPIYISNSQFMNNSIHGEASAGTVVIAEGGATALIVSDSRFAKNLQATGDSSSLIPSFAGPLIGAFGPISIAGSSFVGNTMGQCQAVITSGSTDYNQYHTFITDSTFIANGGNGVKPNSVAGTINSGWIVLDRVTAFLPASVVPTFTQGYNDQYMNECAIQSDTGKPARFNGYQIYNRNPTYTNLVNGTVSGNGSPWMGFADCQQGAAWLPCHQGAQCSTLRNNRVVVGYSCG